MQDNQELYQNLLGPHGDEEEVEDRVVCGEVCPTMSHVIVDEEDSEVEKTQKDEDIF